MHGLEDFGTPNYNYLSGQKLRAKMLLQRKIDVTKERKLGEHNSEAAFH